MFLDIIKTFYAIISGKRRRKREEATIQEIKERNIALQAKLKTLDEIETQLKSELKGFKE